MKILNLIFFIGPDLKEVTLVKALKTWIRCALCNVYCLCLNVETKVGFIVCMLYILVLSYGLNSVLFAEVLWTKGFVWHFIFCIV